MPASQMNLRSGTHPLRGGSGPPIGCCACHSVDTAHMIGQWKPPVHFSAGDWPLLRSFKQHAVTSDEPDGPRKRRWNYSLFYIDKDGGKRRISRSDGANGNSKMFLNNSRLARWQSPRAFVMIWRWYRRCLPCSLRSSSKGANNRSLEPSAASTLGRKHPRKTHSNISFNRVGGWRRANERLWSRTRR